MTKRRERLAAWFTWAAVLLLALSAETWAGMLIK